MPDAASRPPFLCVFSSHDSEFGALFPSQVVARGQPPSPTNLSRQQESPASFGFFFYFRFDEARVWVFRTIDLGSPNCWSRPPETPPRPFDAAIGGHRLLLFFSLLLLCCLLSPRSPNLTPGLFFPSHLVFFFVTRVFDRLQDPFAAARSPPSSPRGTFFWIWWFLTSRRRRLFLFWRRFTVRNRSSGWAVTTPPALDVGCPFFLCILYFLYHHANDFFFLPPWTGVAVHRLR